MSSSKIIICIIIILIADVLSSLLFGLNFSFWNIGLLVKTPIEFYLIINLIKSVKTDYSLHIIFLLFICWGIGILGTIIQTDGVIDTTKANFLNSDKLPNPVLESFLVYNRYIYFFILSSTFYKYRKDEFFVEKCRKIFELFIIVNSISIIIGYFFRINLFSSYNPKSTDLQSRFGYKGLLYGINEVTGVYFLGVAYVYRELFHFKNKKYFLLTVVSCACFLTGAKGTILVFVLLTFFYFAKYKKLLFVLCILPLLLKAISFINIQNIDKIKQLANINFQNNSIISFLLTGRDIYIMNNYKYMLTDWNIVNYFFGDGILYSETDLFDLYYFFGIGVVLYIYGFIYMVLKIDESSDIKYILLIMLIVAFTGGHIIRSGIFPLFLTLYLTTSKFQPKIVIHR